MGLRDLTDSLVYCVCRPAALPMLAVYLSLDLDDNDPQAEVASPADNPAPIGVLAAPASQVPELSPLSMNSSHVLTVLSNYSPHMRPGASKPLSPGEKCPNPRCREHLLVASSSTTVGCKAGHCFSRPVLLSADVSLSITALRRMLFSLL